MDFRPRRWSRLVAQRLGALLAAVGGDSTHVLPSVDGFAGTVADEPPDGGAALVFDPTRPEHPADHAAIVAGAIRRCRPGGRIALVAAGGAPAPAGPLAPRSFGTLVPTLAAAGCRVVAAIPFDALGPCSPWRVRLGARRERVLVELEEHLRFPGVRRAVRLIEAHGVAALRPEDAGRVFVVAETPGATPGPLPAPPALDRLGRELALLLHDDAVVRFVAFVDAEWLAPFGVPLDLRRWCEDLLADETHAAAARARLRAGRRWWQPGLELARLQETMAHRLAERTIATLGRAPAITEGGVDLPPTLLYDLKGVFNLELDRLRHDPTEPWIAG